MPFCPNFPYYPYCETYKEKYSKLVPATSEASFVLKHKFRILSFDNCQWVLTYLVIHIRTLKIYCVAIPYMLNDCFLIQLWSCSNVVQAINSVYVTKFGMQQNCLCNRVYHRSSHYCMMTVIKWNYFPRKWSFVRGIHRSRCFLWFASE